MANFEISTKRIAISKANTQMVVVIAVASFITVFSLVASKELWSQSSYQAHVLSASNKAKTQLITNISAFKTLDSQYNNFQSGQTNIIGGSTSGGGNNSGTNAQIVLDSLPPKYDFPALVTSIQKLFSTANITLTSIAGIDQQLTESSNSVSSSPAPVPMPFSINIESTNYNTIQQVLSLLQSSVRPIAVDTITINGSGNTMSLSITAHSYFQPGKKINISTKTVN